MRPRISNDPDAMTWEEERVEEEAYLYLKGLHSFVMGDVIASEAPEFKSAYFVSITDADGHELDDDERDNVMNMSNQIFVRECYEVAKQNSGGMCD